MTQSAKSMSDGSCMMATPEWPRSTHEPRASRSLRIERVRPPAGFPTTHWSRVAHAGDPAAPEARAALAELCGAYWYPIYAFIRRKGHDPDEALDLTQDYFARLLENGVLAAADRRRGRFRAFLRTDCGFFLAHQPRARPGPEARGRPDRVVDRRPRRRGPLPPRAGRRD